MIEKYKLGPQEALLKLLVNGNFTLLSTDPPFALDGQTPQIGHFYMGFTVSDGENTVDDHVQQHLG